MLVQFVITEPDGTVHHSICCNCLPSEAKYFLGKRKKPSVIIVKPKEGEIWLLRGERLAAAKVERVVA